MRSLPSHLPGQFLGALTHNSSYTLSTGTSFLSPDLASSQENHSVPTPTGTSTPSFVFSGSQESRTDVWVPVCFYFPESCLSTFHQLGLPCSYITSLLPSRLENSQEAKGSQRGLDTNPWVSSAFLFPL